MADLAPAPDAGTGHGRAAGVQPLDRYWRFQLTETGLLLVVSLALGAVAARGVLRPRI